MSPEDDRKDPTVEVEASAFPDAERPHNKGDLEEGESELSPENNSSDNQTTSHDSPITSKNQLVMRSLNQEKKTTPRAQLLSKRNSEKEKVEKEKRQNK